MDSCGVAEGTGNDIGRRPEINWLRMSFIEAGDATSVAMGILKSVRLGSAKPVEERIVAKAPLGAVPVR